MKLLIFVFVFCFFFCGDGKYDQVDVDKNHPAKTFDNVENGRVWANMTKLLKMTIPIHMTTEKRRKKSSCQNKLNGTRNDLLVGGELLILKNGLEKFTSPLPSSSRSPLYTLVARS